MTCICTCMQQGPATVAAVVYPEAPVSLHSSRFSASKLFPTAACQWCDLPKTRREEQCGIGGGSVCVCACALELRSLGLLRLVTGHAAGLARRWQLMLREECGLMCSHAAKGLRLG